MLTRLLRQKSLGGHRGYGEGKASCLGAKDGRRIWRQNQCLGLRFLIFLSLCGGGQRKAKQAGAGDSDATLHGEIILSKRFRLHSPFRLLLRLRFDGLEEDVQ